MLHVMLEKVPHREGQPMTELEERILEFLEMTTLELYRKENDVNTKKLEGMFDSFSEDFSQLENLAQPDSVTSVIKEFQKAAAAKQLEKKELLSRLDSFRGQ